MPRLEELFSDLKSVVMPNPRYIKAEEVPGFKELVDALDHHVDNPDMDILSAEELRAFNTFRITVHRSATANLDTAKKQISATWRGMAKQACIKLAQGKRIYEAVKLFLNGDWPS